jgi:hypothetical protein
LRLILVPFSRRSGNLIFVTALWEDFEAQDAGQMTVGPGFPEMEG